MAEEPVDETHPTHHKHPSHPDNHPHRLHHPHSRAIRGILGVFVLTVLVLTAAIGLITDAPFGPVILSFAPSVLLGLAGIVLLNTDHFDLKHLSLTLLGLLVVFGVFFATAMPDVDAITVTAINLVLGALLILVVAQSHVTEEDGAVVELEPDERSMPDIINTVEDQCKAINFAIGRVYSVHHGGTAGLRDKIRIESDWYNELSAALEDPEEDENLILGSMEKIKRRLAVLQAPEKEVFSDAELSNLKGLERHGKGKSRVVDVLAKNDNDPVDQYVASAAEYVGLALEKLSSPDRP